jgi:aminomethyltransferase
VTSGTFAPTLGKSLAMAIVSSTETGGARDFTIDIRGKPVNARKVELPFYKSRAIG